MSQPTADLIRGVPLFADLDDKTVERLAGEFIERHFDEGAAIATEGTDGLNFFIVASGEAAVTINGQQVGTLGPGTAFGEVALVDKSARSATVTATTPMIAYALPVWSFRPFVEQRRAPPVQRLPTLPELDRLVDRHVAALELTDDLLQLATEVLERALGCVTVAHACTSSTVAARPPVASSISRRLPGASVAASFSAEPPERTTA